jgi:putative salt-induced outer membrane protein
LRLIISKKIFRIFLLKLSRFLPRLGPAGSLNQKMNSSKTIHLIFSGTAFALMAATSVQAQDATATPKWERSAFLGATITQGNSDTELITANILATKKGKDNEYSLGLDAAYGEVDSAKNAEVLHGFAQYNRLFTDRFFGYARLDGLHDGIADVEYRFTFSPGAGYYFIKTQDDNKKTATSLSGEAGPSVITEKVGHDESTYLAARVAEKFEHKFSDKARVWEMAEFLPQVDDFENFIINAEVGAEASLTEKVLLRVSVVDNYDNQPAPGRKENDVKIISSVGYKF